MAVICFVILISGCATPKAPQRVQQVNADVYYGGLYLIAGSVDAIPQRFPALYDKVSPVGSPVKTNIRNLIGTERPSFHKINLKGFDGDLAPDDAIIMANGLTGEKYFSEATMLADSEVKNFNAYLSGALLLQHFKKKPEGGFDINLLACYPYSITIKGLVDDSSTPMNSGGQALLDELLGEKSEDYKGLIKVIAGNVAPVTGLGSTIQVRNISVSEKLSDFVTKVFGGSEKDLKQWVAGEIGAQLSKQIGMPVIPYAEDTSSRKLAQMMESGEAYNIALPPPDYVVDIELLGFARAKQKETATEALWAYGAYVKFAISETATGIQRWQIKTKAAIPKRTWVGQTEVDHSVAEFHALLAVLEQIPKDLLADKKAKSLVESFLK